VIVRFCYVAYEMATLEKSFRWTGPYDVPARSSEEAQDILFWAVQHLVKRHADGGEFYGSRILHTIHFPEECNCDWRQDVQNAIEQVIFERSLKEKYPQGIPRYRSLDASD